MFAINQNKKCPTIKTTIKMRKRIFKSHKKESTMDKTEEELWENDEKLKGSVTTIAHIKCVTYVCVCIRVCQL
jgi:hypothetical protein